MLDRGNQQEPNSDRRNGQPNFHVVGIGASAGGLEALEAFFSAVDGDLGVAFVVVQHLSPDFKSHMEELLARRTSMRIHRVENAMPVEPNCVYLIPPKMEMVISEGKLLLTEKAPGRQLSHPVDQFFRSLGTDMGRYSVGIILSGTGSDGSRGVREIHEAGGLVMVQDEKSAKFDGMPLNAQATTVVDVVADPIGLAHALVQYVREGIVSKQPDAIDSDARGLAHVFELLRRDHGVDFSLYKESTVGRRIERRAQLGNFKSLEDYMARLGQDPTELSHLYKDLLIGVTRFFRDAEAFAVLAKDVIPRIVEEAEPNGTIRVWVAGCASGEEAYSLAMLFSECIANKHSALELKIFATDVHHRSLRTAAQGVYPEEALQEVSEERRYRFFRQQRDGYHVTRELRKCVLFAPHNAISDAPFTQMDLVVCRNLLIYFQPQPQKKALAMFHFALKTGGTLWLGPSESPGDFADEFQVVNSRWRIYRKRRDVRLPLDVRVPLIAGPAPLSPPINLLKKSSGAPSIDRNLLATYDRLMDRYMPASVLVSENFDLIHTFGGAERFLAVRRGRATTNILELVEAPLRTPLTSGLQHVLKSNSPVHLHNISFQTEAQSNVCLNLSIEPIFDSHTNVTNYLIVIEVQPTADGSNAEGASDNRGQLASSEREHMQSLEMELRFSRENLQTTVEELETSNEELQATNEELVASNEELQSTNEELHSVNEELYTVNAEHQRRVEELAEANDDMDNLLASTHVGVMFLDNDLLIRRFTPEIAKIFHIVPQDVGRSIRGFAHNLTYPNLIADLEQVLADGQEAESEIADQRGNSFIARISAYRSSTKSSGVVLTLIDVTTSRELRAEAARLASVIDSTPDFVGMLDANRKMSYLNAAAREMFGIEPGRSAESCSLNDFFAAEMYAVLDHALETAQQFGRWQGESVLVLPTGETKSGSQVVLAHRNQQGEVTHYSTIFRDISHIHESKRALAESEASLRRIIDNMLSFVGVLELNGTLVEANLAATRAADVQRSAVIGQKFWDGPWWRHNPFEVARLKEAIEKAKQGTVVRYDATISIANNESMDIDFMLVPIKDDQGKVTHLIPSGVDITARKRAEADLRVRQLAIESSTNGILITDATQIDCPIIYANQGFWGLTGYSPQEVIGHNCRFLQGENTDQDDVLVLREAIAAGEDCRVTILNYRKDGTPFWNDLQVNAIRDNQGKLVFFVGVQHDITEQIKAEERATEAAERIKALLDSTAEGIYGLDAQGRCTFCNAACANLLGYDHPDQLIGKNMHALVHYSHADGSDFPEADCPIFQAFQSGEHINVDQDCFWRADGTKFPVEYWSHPIRKDGRISGAVVTFFDTTKRVQQQAELQMAQKSADAANRAKSQFLANMSHELRTPMAVVMGFADIILQESEDQRVHERIAVIQRNGEYLLNLLNDILDLSRVEAGAVVLEHSQCDLPVFLRDLHEMMQVRAREAKRPLTFELPEFLPATITTDVARLRQILVNIIGNGIKFSPHGDVCVRVAMTRLQTREAIRFEIADTGIGMKADHQQKLFQPFSQASEKIAREFGGTGLGLSICKRLVDSLGGELKLDSEWGKGSTFVVTIPVDPIGSDIAISIDAKIDRQTTTTEDVELLDARVLLADDMRDVRYVAKHFLQKAGCEVTVVENGREAVDAIVQAAQAGKPFDLAIIDMQMPVLDGIEAIRELRSRDISIPAIALTADAMKGTRERTLSAGYNCYLSKPIRGDTLIASVREALGN